MQTIHVKTELEVASRYERVEPYGNDPSLAASHQQFSYKSRSGTPFRIWMSHNRTRPWRTASVRVAEDGFAKGCEVFSHHAGHETLESALEWLQAFD
jgi:hypothetical protein